MTNIKYLNREIKQKVDGLLKKDKFYKKILLKLLNKWNIVNPLIENYYIDYDSMIFNIVDKYSIFYEIKIDLDLNSVVVI